MSNDGQVLRWHTADGTHTMIAHIGMFASGLIAVDATSVYLLLEPIGSGVGGTQNVKIGK